MELSDFSGLHKGLEIDLLLKGPSSSLWQDQGHVTVAVNDYWNSYQTTPMYAICQDARAHKHTGYPPPGRFPAMWFVPDWKTYPEAEHLCAIPMRFGLDIDYSFKGPVPAGWRITTALAMQICAGLGASQINVYGLDLGDDYQKEIRPDAYQWCVDRHRRFFRAFREVFPGQVNLLGSFDAGAGTPCA